MPEVWGRRGRAGVPGAARVGLVLLTSALLGHAGSAVAAAEACPAAKGPHAAMPAQPGETSRARLAEALRGGYGVQYWGEDYTAERLAAAPHGLLIIELTFGDTGGPGGEIRFSREEVDRIRRGGERPVLAYLNVAEIETYRDYHREADPGAPRWWTTTSDHGEVLAAFWSPAWHEALGRRVDEMMALGVDGIFLDDAMHYFSMADLSADPDFDPARDQPEGFQGHATEMMSLVSDLARRARSHVDDAIVVVNNAAFIGRDAGPENSRAFDLYRDQVDGLLVENALGPDGHPDTVTALSEDFLSHGIRVLSLDVTADDPAGLAERSRALGFCPYVPADDVFNRLYPPAVREAG